MSIKVFEMTDFVLGEKLSCHRTVESIMSAGSRYYALPGTEGGEGRTSKARLEGDKSESVRGRVQESGDFSPSALKTPVPSRDLM